ncbi:glutathione peroxidase [Marichromatium gracile]|uniref:Glutathione peroxidase n=2 Tax=Marichromatium TaxID=85076 RepID=A0A4R4A9E9_MARGR|nr:MULTISPECIES: glutathione peroxidase [Marichromatium]MBO8087364.1 glutathione peroxidase [Marichromatium sp.]KXX63442.1 glutathione peroxidase [Marichromatium gracile]MBK1708556.1 glutathione peroxidase [Marichromatium gracile]MCF1183126.1 glutathione peroxidase [Marichromatium gracile]NKN34383.1 glutathione peroxidase [Marichromatium bheemlicum]
MRLPLFALGLAAATQVAAESPACSSLLDLEVRRLAGDERVNLCEAYQGKVILVVNTASKCGFTPQYEGLEALYRDYADRGLVVLGFPSNDFANQEPGDEAEIRDFCRLTYSVEFPMFEKVSVKRGRAAPLFERLAAAGAPYPKWNFYKYLIDREGNLVESYSSITKPQSGRLVRAIERLL